MTHVLIVGAGFCGRYALQALKSVSRETQVSATSRSSVPIGFDSVFAFGEEIDFSTITHLVMTAAPEVSGDPFLTRYGGCDFPSLKGVVYLSTTVVYGDAGGAFVDEESSLLGTSERALRRIAVEKAWVSRFSCPVTLLRLAGLYGEGRNALLDLAAGTARRTYKEGHVFNRIHGADVGRAIAYFVTHPFLGAVNGADNAPDASHKVVDYAASLTGLPLPPLVPLDVATLSPMALSFWQDHKRVRNNRLRSLVGDLLYPDYRAGLRALWAAQT